MQIEGVESVTAQLGTLVSYVAKSNESDNQSSGFSLSASSKSCDERLQELESLSSGIMEKLDFVVKTLSSRASTHSSAALDDVNKASSPDAKPEESNAEAEDVFSGELATTVQEQIKGPKRVNMKETEDVQETATEASTVDGDVESIFALFDDFYTLAGQHFDGIIAEYVSTAELWRAAHIREMLLAVVAMNPDASRIKFNDTLGVNVCHLARRLLSLRRRAEQESLSDVIVEADKVLEISADVIANWQKLADEEQHQLHKDQSLRLDHQIYHVNPYESLLRLDEWFLTVMFVIPHLADLHQSMIPSFVREELKLESSRKSVQYRDIWEKLTIKS